MIRRRALGYRRAMDPTGAQDAARQLTEGINTLAVFLCGPALERCGGDAGDLLRLFADEYASTLRRAAPRGPQHDPFLVALDRLTAAARSGVDLKAPRDVAALRRSIREVLAGLGMALPAVPAAEAAVCELHGASCPVRSGGA